MLTKNFSGALQLTDLDDFIGPSQVEFFFCSIVFHHSIDLLQQCIIPMQNKLADDADAGLIKLRTKKSTVRYSSPTEMTRNLFDDQ